MHPARDLHRNRLRRARLRHQPVLRGALDGSNWTIAGNPPGPVFAPGGVAFASPSTCEAVGAGPPKKGAQRQPEAEQWNGMTCTTQHAPDRETRS